MYVMYVWYVCNVCNVCMYVCLYVCMYVRMYVCMHVCMYVRTYVRTYVCMYAYIFIYRYVSPCNIPSGIVFQLSTHRETLFEPLRNCPFFDCHPHLASRWKMGLVTCGHRWSNIHLVTCGRSSEKIIHH